MRLPSEAGWERRERKSIEGRCQDNATRVAVNILPIHTAACNICGIKRSKRSEGENLHEQKKGSQRIVLCHAHVHFGLVVLLSENEHRWAARQSRL